MLCSFRPTTPHFHFERFATYAGIHYERVSASAEDANGFVTVPIEPLMESIQNMFQALGTA